MKHYEWQWGVWTADQGYFVVHARGLNKAIAEGRAAWVEWKGKLLAYRIGLYLPKSKQYSPIAVVCLETPQMAALRDSGVFDEWREIL